MVNAIFCILNPRKLNGCHKLISNEIIKERLIGLIRWKFWVSLQNVLGKCAESKVSEVMNFLYWANNRSNFQEVIQSKNLHKFTNLKQINTIFIVSSVCKT